MYADPEEHKFTVKHRWQVKLHFLSGAQAGMAGMAGTAVTPWTPRHDIHSYHAMPAGITWPGITALLAAHWRHIDWATYWHRVRGRRTLLTPNCR
jgi:hypothetical protein